LFWPNFHHSNFFLFFYNFKKWYGSLNSSPLLGEIKIFVNAI
jgi:hypothetical protein